MCRNSCQAHITYNIYIYKKRENAKIMKTDFKNAKTRKIKIDNGGQVKKNPHPKTAK